MELKLQDSSGQRLWEGDYFKDVPLLYAELEFAETFEDMLCILKRYLKYKEDVAEVYSDGDENGSLIVFQIKRSNDYKVFVTIKSNR